jgi:spermidine synthase
LGYAIEVCCRKGTVEHITVIEKSPDVIKLSGPHYLKRYPDKLTIIQADAFTWEPPKGMRYDVVWHDIWNNNCSDNLVEMDQLEQKYEYIADWQGCWDREACEYMQCVESLVNGIRGRTNKSYGNISIN